MVRDPVRDVVHALVDDEPGISSSVVNRDLLPGEYSLAIGIEFHFRELMLQVIVLVSRKLASEEQEQTN